MKKLLLLVAILGLTYGANAQVAGKSASAATISQASAASSNGYARISYKPDLETVFVMISSGGATETATIRITTPNGTLVAKQLAEANHLFFDHEVGVSHLSPGLYYLTVNSNSIQYATSFKIL